MNSQKNKKITLLKNNKGVHLPHPSMDTTLCGDADEGWDEVSALLPINKGDTLNCPSCIAIVNLCLDYADQPRVKKKNFSVKIKKAKTRK